VLGGTPPQDFTYELFLDGEGQKISKSRGNGLTLEEWLRYGPQESLAYYIHANPKSAKRLHFDVIPRAVDDYLTSLDAYRTQEPVKALDNPVWSVHRGRPPQWGSPIPFSLLLNLVSVANVTDKAKVWAYIARYRPGATPENEPLLDELVGHALAYFEDFVRPAKRFRAPTEQEREAMLDLAARLRALPADTRDAETIQAEVYAAGKAAGFEPLRAWFAALYEVLLGDTQGPRFGGFAAVYGLTETIALIEAGAEGALAQAA
jgi:lysyl-tRNA synthetase class 1